MYINISHRTPSAFQLTRYLLSLNNVILLYIKDTGWLPGNPPLFKCSRGWLFRSLQCLFLHSLRSLACIDAFSTKTLLASASTVTIAEKPRSPFLMITLDVTSFYFSKLSRHILTRASFISTGLKMEHHKLYSSLSSSIILAVVPVYLHYYLTLLGCLFCFKDFA